VLPALLEVYAEALARGGSSRPTANLPGRETE
jgi:hypothetical protein